MLHSRLRAAAGRDRIPTDGLIAHYTMDNISGSTLVDETENYDATIYGSPTQVAGVIGQALDFPNGSGNYFDTGISSWAPAAFTISQWIYFDSISALTEEYVAIHSSRPPPTGVTGIFTYQAPAANSATGNASFRPHVYTDAGLVSFDTSFVVTTGSWIHLVIKYDGSLNVYVNGSLDVNGGVSGGAVVGTTNTLWFAEDRRTVELGLDGKLDQVRIYNRGLTQAEVTQLYNEGA